MEVLNERIEEYSEGTKNELRQEAKIEIDAYLEKFLERMQQAQAENHGQSLTQEQQYL